MSKQDVIVFTAAGLLAWLAVTLFYMAGGAVVESAFWVYALNAFGAAAVVTLAFEVIARLRRFPRGRRLFPALAFGLPVLAGGDLVVVNFQRLVSDDPVSLGRYGAFVVVMLIALGASLFERGPQKARV